MTRRILSVVTAACGLLAVAGLAQAAGFEFKDTPGQYLDVVLDGKTVGRYMYAYDKANLADTYKPYLHVFDPEGKGPITKGPGGLYTHHRGIFIGWNKIGFGGKSYDRWHMKGGEIVHQKFLDQKADRDAATFTSLTHWNDEAGQPMVVEERTMTFRRAPAPAYVLVDFTASLKAPKGDVMLDGDPEHAGIHYRPADEVVTKETAYVFPKEDADPKTDLDYPWVGETYTLAGKRYSVVEMNHPGNPKETKFSAYRDYGRFGAFFTKEIKSGDTLVLKYRFLVATGEMPATTVIQKCWDQFAGATRPTPTPKITVVGGSPQAGAAKKPAAPKTPKAK